MTFENPRWGPPCVLSEDETHYVSEGVKLYRASAHSKPPPIPPDMLRFHAKVGTRAHHFFERSFYEQGVIETALRGLAEDPGETPFGNFNEMVSSALAGFVGWRSTWHAVEPIGVELRLAHRPLGYACTIDLVAKLQKSPGTTPFIAQLDWKTSSSIGRAAWTQAAAYNIALNACEDAPRVDCVGVVRLDKRTPGLFQEEIYDADSAKMVAHREEFLDIVEEKGWRNGYREG